MRENRRSLRPIYSTRYGQRPQMYNIRLKAVLDKLAYAIKLNTKHRNMRHNPHISSIFDNDNFQTTNSNQATLQTKTEL